MSHEFQKLNKFYHTPLGALCLASVRARVAPWIDLNPNLASLRCGHAIPALWDSLGAPVGQKQGVFHLCQDLEGPMESLHKGPKEKTRLPAFLVAQCGLSPFSTNSFDQILCCHFLDYSPDWQVNLQDLYRILKPEGSLVLLVPNTLSPWSKATVSPYQTAILPKPGHLRQFIKSTGFHIQAWQTVINFPPMQKGLPSQLVKKLDHLFASTRLGALLAIKLGKRQPARTPKVGVKAMATALKSKPKAIPVTSPTTKPLKTRKRG